MFELKRRRPRRWATPSRPTIALLDDYEPGESTANVSRVLAELRDALVPLVAAIAASGRSPDVTILTRHYPEAAQRSVWQRGGGADRLRLSPRPAGRDGPSVLHVAGPARLPDHHPLRRALFSDGAFRHSARGGTRHLRPGPADRVVRPAAGRGDFAGDSRIAIAAVGEPGRPQPAVLAAFFPGGPGGVSRRWRTWRSTIFISPSTTCGRR